MFTAATPLIAEREVDLPVAHRLPLVLDLDGTVLRTNLLLEGALRLLRRRPLALFLLIRWACAGRAVLKRRLAEEAALAVELLPVAQALIDHAAAGHAAGREVFVASAADATLAARVAARFPFVSGAIASDGRTNLKGRAKAAALRARFPGGFVYAGDAAADMAVWRTASLAVFAGRDRRLGGRLARTVPIEAAFPTPAPTAADWRRALRLHQWAKNALLFVPALLAGRALEPAVALGCLAGFVAMGLAASATYLVNDLTDLEEDRRHWSKRHRPLAAGVIGIAEAGGAALLLLGLGLGLAAAACGAGTAALIGTYCAATLAYSLGLKRVPVLDVAMLAGLFTLRLAVGAEAAGVATSAWLLVFSMFLFLSLALAKRATELQRHRVQAIAGDAGALAGRGYVAADIGFVQALGVASSVTSVLILVLYLVDEAFPGPLYGEPRLLWSVPVLVGLWLGRVWLLCGRGQMADDPVLFALRDRVSLMLGAGVAAGFVLAAVCP